MKCEFVAAIGVASAAGADPDGGSAPEMPPPPPRALICVDFDGTVVDPSHDPAFPEAMANCLGTLRSHGVAWAIATGRSLFQAVEGIANHGVTPLPDFLISSERELFRRGGHSRWIPVGDWNERCAKDTSEQCKDGLLREQGQRAGDEH